MIAKSAIACFALPTIFERTHLKMTRQDSYAQMEQVRERLIELFHYQKNRLAYRKRTEIAVEIVKQIESEKNFRFS